MAAQRAPGPLLRLTAITAVGASRQAARLQLQCPQPFVRSYSNGESSFIVRTPKASKQHNKQRGKQSYKKNIEVPGTASRHDIDGRARQRQVRDSPLGSPPFARTSSRRILALGTAQSRYPAQHDTDSTKLHLLQTAIDGQDLAAVLSAWQQVGSSAWQLGRDEHHKLLRLCASHSFSSPVSSADSRVRDQAPAFASAAWPTGDADLITGWFRDLLANEQHEEIIRIWKELVRTRLESGPKQYSSDDAEVSRSTEQVGNERFVRLDESINGDRVDIHDMVCLVTFACAQSSRSSSLVDLFDKVEFGSPFRLFFIQPRAKQLFKATAETSGQTFKPDRTYFSEMLPLLQEVELARGLSSGSGGPQRIARLLGSLFQARKVDEAYEIFQTAMKASWLAFEQPGQSSGSNPERAQWTESCWSVCLSNFIASGRTELAMKVWTEFQQKQFRPTPRIWNALLDGYGQAKNYSAAQQTWSTAIKQASSDTSIAQVPDEQMYTTMINIHFRAKKDDEALSLLAEMVAHSDRNGGRLQTGAETFNAVLHGLFLNKRQTQAQALLEEMLTKGPRPNIGTINTFLRAHGRVGDLQALATTLRLADKLKLVPDVVTFTTILDALLRKGGESATEAVVRTLDIMNSTRVQPNVVTYTAMIKACLVGAEAAQLDLASKSMLGNTVSRKRSDTSVRIEAALQLLDRMLQAKVAPSEITYTALIGGCLQNPDAVAHAFATKVVPKQYCSAPRPLQRLQETAQVVQRWKQESPEVSLSLLLLEHMKGRGLIPTSATYRFLIEGLCSTRTDHAAFVRAMDLIDEMILRSPSSDPTRKLGPFASSVLEAGGVEDATLHAPSHTTWIIIFSSLLDRLENGPRNRGATRACSRALATAVRLVREMGSLSGADGGMSLTRLVERAASLTSRLSR